MTELKSYDLPELEALAEQIKAEIAKREKEEEERARRAVEEAEAAARAAAEKAAREAAEAEQKARETAEQAARAREAETKIRYMHPSNRALTWSGVGPTPDWVHAWLVTGGTLYALEVAAEKLAPRPIPESLRPR
ncbi:H-NS family nucleoid-associated regulatory protein [uncultured Zoogloea sp.]|uniref:H-NS family nucleoid-associated regulatory protein n=1 Tax=uncultured Zoogloea sp. TaxID=160237 RepID=UPI00262C2E0F|nr:H-NS family nucleoid-associated regulatory protein [uncultured Zoogloea sp.]